MNLQVLVATMNQTRGDYSLLEKMNIQTDAIVCNQCYHNDFEDFEMFGHSIRWLSFAEKGVGLNRNNALMRATGDIVIFADDDMVYIDGYASIVNRAFRECGEADVILFNVRDKARSREEIRIVKKVGRLNYLRYGTARIAARLSSVKLKGIYFNQCFGGGTEHCHGEDNLFLAACIDKGLKLYAYPAIIAELTEERASTWNAGYDEKYLVDQGDLYKQISRKWWKLLCIQDAIRHSKIYRMSPFQAYSRMVKR